MSLPVPPFPLAPDPSIYLGPSWTVRVPLDDGKDGCLTENDHAMHWGRRKRITDQLAQDAGWAFKAAKLPRLERAHVLAVFCFRSGADDRDTATNWAPTAKAHMDAWVRLGWMPDDNDGRMLGPHLFRGPAAPQPHVTYLVYAVDPGAPMPFRLAEPEALARPGPTLDGHVQPSLLSGLTKGTSRG